MKTRNKAFTFVELIVSIGIFLLVTTIGYVSYSGSVETKDNAKVSSDLATIDNSFKSYFAENKSLPEANGNQSFYKDDGSYAHDASDSAYGVSSFISEKTLPAKYLNSIPLDPRTKYYYAYAKTIDNKYYEIAGVIKKDNNYKSIVSGYYPTKGNELSNLIREYNGPEFVANNSTIHFPYNPEEKILTAQVNDYSGIITITHKGNTITQTDGTGILDTALVTGDKIVVGVASTASIFFSDGSKAYLGDKNTASELNLSDMSYKEDSNLFTKVKLVLNIGTLWTSASKMSDNSNFEVDSSNTVAAVRGTIFGVSVDAASNTNVVLAKGKISVSKIDTAGIITPFYFPYLTDASGIISVTGSEAPKGIQVPSTATSPSSSTGAINEIPGNQDNINNVISGDTNISLSDYKIKLINVTNSGTTTPYQNFQAKIGVDKKLLNNFQYFKLDDTYIRKFDGIGTGTYTFTGYTTFASGNTNLVGINNTANGTLQMQGSISSPLQYILSNSNINGKFELRACKINQKGEEICSKSLNLKVPNGLMNYSPKCQKEIVTFGTEQVDDSLCDDGYELVGYAGYNYNNGNYHNLDLNTYINSTNSVIYSSGASINNTKLVQSGSLFYTSGDLTNSLSGTMDGVYYNFLDNGIFDFGGNKGIFLDNWNPTNDFLQYNIGDLNLNSGSGFAIEMSVRGAALKRNDGHAYNLFTLGNYTMYINTNLYDAIGTTMIRTTPSGTDRSSYEGNISDNKFYKVISIYNNGTLSIYIYDENNGIIVKRENISISSTLLIGDTLYVGSTKDKLSQWNDIIDYVKVYKR
ncbi:MAG: FecR domain-containing protein [Candidatus Gracilibacteria bacterium]|nr:FecR domain-containing protein [Candidatus Gracilibacteria bacterium]